MRRTAGAVLFDDRRECCILMDRRALGPWGDFLRRIRLRGAEAMNSYERYMAMVEKRPVDFLPRVPILMQFAAEYIGSNYGAFASDYRVLTEANLRCCDDFGIDQVSAISDPYRETQGFGGDIEFVPHSTPRCLRPPLRDNPDLSQLKQPDPLTSERMKDRIDAVRFYKEQIGGQRSILGWVEGAAAEAGDLRSVQNFMMDLLTDPDYAAELLDRCLETAIAFAREQIRAGADTIGIGDALASQVSTDTYASLIQPREKELVRAIQAESGLARLHICGDITHLLPGIADLGLDILDVDWMVDIRQVREAVGPDVVLTGNLDPVSAVRFSNPEAIRQAVLDSYAAAGAPFFVNAGCEIPAGTPIENLKALCEPVIE